MRKKSENLQEIEGILKECEICHIGFCDGDRPYVLPMNFGYEIMDGTLLLYLHGGKKGRKIDILTRNKNVCVQMESGASMRQGKEACNTSASYASAVCEGGAEMLESAEEKIRGLNAIMERIEPGKAHTYADAQVEAVNVICVTCHTCCGKWNRKEG